MVYDAEVVLAKRNHILEKVNKVYGKKLSLTMFPRSFLLSDEDLLGASDEVLGGVDDLCVMFGMGYRTHSKL